MKRNDLVVKCGNNKCNDWCETVADIAIVRQVVCENSGGVGNLFENKDYYIGFYGIGWLLGILLWLVFRQCQRRRSHGVLQKQIVGYQKIGWLIIILKIQYKFI